jgi:hypothetical protein
VQYKAWVKEGRKMKKVLDSSKMGDGKPISFQQGHYNLAKCWDLALPQLRAGEQVKLHCPAYYAQNGEGMHSQFSSQHISQDTPIDYEISLLECERSVDAINLVNKKYGSETIVEAKNDEKRVNYSGLKKLKSSTHDANGEVLRSGGGIPKGYVPPPAPPASEKTPVSKKEVASAAKQVIAMKGEIQKLKAQVQEGDREVADIKKNLEEEEKADMADDGQKTVDGAAIVANGEKALEVQAAQETQKSTLQQTEKVAGSAEKSIEQAAKLEGKKGSAA